MVEGRTMQDAYMDVGGRAKHDSREGGGRAKQEARAELLSRTTHDAVAENTKGMKIIIY